MLLRKINLLKILEKKSLFLFGPRQTGKTSLVLSQLPGIPLFNLLDSQIFLQFAQKPWQLRELIPANTAMVVIDEIQKMPELLDEVQFLIDTRKINFLLTGSSTRKLKNHGVNLLGGRARTRILHPFSAVELGDEFNLLTALNWGLLPPIYLSDDPRDDLKAYCGDYLRMEIAQEGLARNIGAFSRFLEVAAANNTHLLNYTNIANDTAVPRTTVMEYFQILRDTFLGFDVKPWQKTVKRKPLSTAKFYFFDTGVARNLKNAPLLEKDSYDLGEAFEAWVCHELKTYTDYNSCTELCYWRSTSGFEVDFIFNDTVAIEVKSTRSVTEKDLKGLRALREECPLPKNIIICREPFVRETEDGILVLPWQEFIKRLWSDSFLNL